MRSQKSMKIKLWDNVLSETSKSRRRNGNQPYCFRPIAQTRRPNSPHWPNPSPTHTDTDNADTHSLPLPLSLITTTVFNAFSFLQSFRTGRWHTPCRIVESSYKHNGRTTSTQFNVIFVFKWYTCYNDIWIKTLVSSFFSLSFIRST